MKLSVVFISNKRSKNSSLEDKRSEHLILFSLSVILQTRNPSYQQQGKVMKKQRFPWKPAIESP